MKKVLRNTGLVAIVGLLWMAGYSQDVKKSESKVKGPEMVFVQGGNFEMGLAEANLVKKSMSSGEMPAHRVNLNSFYIGKYEVTQKEWTEVMGSNPSKFKDCENCPVECVNWTDAIRYCNYLSIREKLTPFYSFKEETNPDKWNPRRLNKKELDYDPDSKGYRLPTEAEWEYAARGGKETKGFKYSGGDNLDEVAWYRSDSEKKTHHVGEKKPNELGIYDMTGNITEWCNDWYNEIYYSISPKDNPMGQDTGQVRVLRGGSWVDFKYSLGLTYRFKAAPENKEGYGFRVVRSK